MNVARTQALLEQFCRMVRREYADLIYATNPSSGWSSYVTGDMARGFRYFVQVYKNSFEVTFELEQPDGYIQEFGLDSGYGAYSMGGSFPDVGEIEDWVRNKGFRFEHLTGPKAGQPMSFKETTYLAARKVANEGFDARFFFERAVDRAFPYLDDELVEKFGLDVDDFLEQLEIYD